MEERKDRSFSFAVKPTASQLWRFSVHYANSGFRGIVNLILVGGSLFLLAGGWRSLEALQRGLLVFIVLLFVVWQPAMLYLKSLRQAKELEKHPALELTFHEEGVEIVREDARGHIAWEDICRIEAVGSMIIVYSDPVHASLISRAIMGDEEEAFRQLIREKLPRTRRKRI